jgi:hypothetical protein
LTTSRQIETLQHLRIHNRETRLMGKKREVNKSQAVRDYL